jgi:hypothetical protein
LHGKEPDPTIFTIDVFSSAAPLPTNMYKVALRMFATPV